MSPPDEDPAEAALWSVLERRLALQGVPEVAIVLRHLVRAVAKGDEPLGPWRRYRFELQQRVSEYSSRNNARTGEALGWFFDVLFERCAPGHNGAACLRTATEVATAPADAHLETAELETHGDAQVFVARWRHLHRGIVVEGDYIQVLVNPRTNKAFAMSRRWRTVDLRPNLR